MSGPPARVWTENHRLAVSICVASGIPFDAIARSLGVSTKTLERRFPNELKRGAMEIKMRMTTVLAQKALAGDVSAIKFYLGQRYAEWRTQYVEAKPAELPGNNVHFYLPVNGRDMPEVISNDPIPEVVKERLLREAVPEPKQPRGAPVVELPHSSWRKLASRS